MTEIKKKIKNLDFDFLNEELYSEEFLKKMSEFIPNNEASGKIIYSLLEKIPNYGKDYDWNVGSILQHLSPTQVFKEFKKFDFVLFLNSIGLVWVFGEYNLRNELIVNYLYEVLNNSSSDSAWWKAGFSLGKIRSVNPVALLKNSLKSKGLKTLDYYLDNLDKETSIIGILLFSSNLSIKKIIYPKLKLKFLDKKNKSNELINCIWLLGRLNLIDKEIYQKMEEIIKKSKNYELIYYTFFAIQENISERFIPLLKESLLNSDPLIRRMVVRGLSNIFKIENLIDLNNLLSVEKDEKVIKELSEGIYRLKNIESKNEFSLLRKYCENENGLIIDESDKWYGDPAIYNIFSESEDPENICFNLIKNKLKQENIPVKNPIDIACGTGRTTRQIINSLNFEGMLISVDINQKMIEFLEKSSDRRKDYTKNIKIIKSSINDLKLEEKSTFIISTFGFPSKTFDKKNSLKELKKIYSLLDNRGVFVTIGWDESFNDELNYFWYKFLPDDIDARSFEGWRMKRSKKIISPRNCNLSWLKKGLAIPLQFSSLNEAAYVMGHLFGRDALEEIIKSKKTKWIMMMGVTYNTKEELKEIIKKIEKNERN